MQAYEFSARLDNGVIYVPEKYKNKIKSEVKVILLEKKVSNTKKAISPAKRTDLLSPISIDTRGWKFNKEEANER